MMPAAEGHRLGPHTCPRLHASPLLSHHAGLPNRRLLLLLLLVVIVCHHRHDANPPTWAPNCTCLLMWLARCKPRWNATSASSTSPSNQPEASLRLQLFRQAAPQQLSLTMDELVRPCALQWRRRLPRRPNHGRALLVPRRRSALLLKTWLRRRCRPQ